MFFKLLTHVFQYGTDVTILRFTAVHGVVHTLWSSQAAG